MPVCPVLLLLGQETMGRTRTLSPSLHCHHWELKDMRLSLLSIPQHCGRKRQRADPRLGENFFPLNIVPIFVRFLQALTTPDLYCSLQRHRWQ